MQAFEQLMTIYHSCAQLRTFLGSLRHSYTSEPPHPPPATFQPLSKFCKDRPVTRRLDVTFNL